jgi:endoglucanase
MRYNRPGMRLRHTAPRTSSWILVAAISLLVLAVAPATASRDARSDAIPLNSLGTWRLFNYHNTPATAEAARMRADGAIANAKLMEMIANQPIATWFTKTSLAPRREVEELTTNAAEDGEVPVIVAYDIPGQGCERGAAGRGASSRGRYLRWVKAMAAGIGRRRTIVIVEPDALPLALSGCPIHIADLRAAVQALARAPGARIYIDAGNSSWVQSVHGLAAALEEVGIGLTAGFSLNVSNFQTDAASIAYGQQLSGLLGGAHFVIDTSRNGNGPDTNLADEPRWCNPPGRALGRPPSTVTGVAGLDAYLWIKAPGASDESCRPGEPAPGVWWAPYALELAANAAAENTG